MRRFSIVIVLLLLLLLCFDSASALNTPHVGKGGGVVTLMVTGDVGFALGGEYGLTERLAIIADYRTPFTRVGAKYQLTPGWALLGGISIQGRPYIGVNGSIWLANRLEAVMEINALIKNQVSLPYELGGRFVLGNNWDLRLGLFGTVDLNNIMFPTLKLGFGYRF